MRLIPRRFLIILFALLQCMAPLMHAHAHAEGHSGIHLPGLSDVHEHGQETAWVEVQEADYEAAVGLALTLQPRPDGGHATAGSIFRLRGPLSAHSGLSPPPADAVVLPGSPPHLIPLPGAPPAA